MAFINLSVQKGMHEINALRRHEQLGDPEEFYINQ